MEDRFKMWLKLCQKDGSLEASEIKAIKNKDFKMAKSLMDEFSDYDKSAFCDFIFDCMIDLKMFQTVKK